MPRAAPITPLNTIILFATSNGSSVGFDAVTWIPYKHYHHCRAHKNRHKKIIWLERPREYVLNNTHLYPNKMPSHFEGCEVAICPFNHYASNITTQEIYLENKIISTIFSALKFRTISHVSHVESCDIMHGAIPLDNPLITQAAFTDISFFTHSYLSVREMWFVPSKKLNTVSGNFVKVFSFSLWILIVLALIVVGFTIQKVGIMTTNESYLYKSISFSLCHMWAVLVGVGVSQMPLTGRMRVIFILWVCYCFAISTVFQAFFTSYIIEPTKETGISTLQEMAKTPMKFEGNIVTLYTWCLRNVDLCDYMSGKLGYCDMSGKLEYCDWSTIRIDDGVDDNTSFIVTDIEMSFNGKWTALLKHHCPLKVSIHSVNYYMLIQRTFPFILQVNKLITTLTEGGITEKIKRNSLLFFGKRVVNFHKQDGYDNEIGDYFAFNMSHLHFAFFTYLLGVCIGLAVFLGELIFTRITKYISSTK